MAVECRPDGAVCFGGLPDAPFPFDNVLHFVLQGSRLFCGDFVNPRFYFCLRPRNVLLRVDLRHGRPVACQYAVLHITFNFVSDTAKAIRVCIPSFLTGAHSYRNILNIKA